MFAPGRLAAVVAGVWMLGAGAAHAGQGPGDQDAAAPRHPTLVRTSVAMVSDHIRHMAGQPVLVLDGLVERIASPRVFIVTGRQLRSTHWSGRPDRLAVVLRSGETLVNLETKAPIVVTGVAFTYEGARISGGLPPPIQLSDDDRDRLQELSIVLASSVETPGGVALLRPE